VPIPGAALVGGIAGGIAGGMGASAAQEEGLKALGYDDAIQRAANVKEHPYWSAAGQAASNIAGFGAGAVQAGTRLLSGAISGAGEIGSQIYQRGGQFFTPEGLKEAAPSIAAQTAAGLTLAKPYAWGQRLEQAGARLGGRSAGAPATGTIEQPAAAYGESQPPSGRSAYAGYEDHEGYEAPTPSGRSAYEGYESPSDTPHGPPGADAAAGTAQEQPPPREQGRHGPEDYGKETTPAGPPAGVNIGDVDPTLDAAVRQTSEPRPADPYVPAPGGLAQQIAGLERRPTGTPEPPPAPLTPEWADWVGRRTDLPPAPAAPAGPPGIDAARAEGFNTVGEQLKARQAVRSAAAERAPTADEQPLQGPTPAAESPRTATAPEAAPPTRSPADFRNPDLNREISAAEYGQRLAELGASKPPPINEAQKANLSPGMIKALRRMTKEWNDERRQVTNMQKLAQTRENAGQPARQPLVIRATQRTPGGRAMHSEPLGVRAPTVGDQLKAKEAARRTAEQQALNTRQQEILERGYARATGPRLAGETLPGRQAMARRKAPDYSGLTDQHLRDMGKYVSSPADREAIINELQRRQNAKLAGQPAQPAAPAARPTAQPATPAARQAPPRQTQPGARAQQAPAAAGGAPPRQPPTPPRTPAGAGQPPAGAPRQPRQPTVGPPHQPPAPLPPVSRATARDLQRGPFAYIGRLFHAREGSGVEANLIYRKARGEWNRLKDIAAARLSDAMHQTANKMDMNGFRTFMQHVEGVGGRTIAALPQAQRELATALRRGLDDVKNKIASMPKFAQMQFVQDYFPHLYENNQQLNTFFQNLASSSHGSLHKRTLPTYEDAFNAGLTPISSNPVEMFTRYIDGIGTAVQQAQIMHELEPWIQWLAVKKIGASGSPTPHLKNTPFLGYEPLQMPWAQRHRGPVTETAWVPRDMAYMLNQAYNTGFRGGTLGPAIDAAQKIKNTHTALELGGPMYHFNTVTTEGIGSGFARALREFATMRPDRAAREFALALPRAVLDWAGGSRSYGTHLMDIYQGKKTGTAQEMRIMDALAKANIHPVGLLHTGEYEMTHLNDLWTSYWRGDFPREMQAIADKIKGGGWEGTKEALMFTPNMVARAMQTIGKPLFQYVIPRLKMTAMVRDMEQYLHYNPAATDADLQRAAYRISNSIDNRFGEAVRDNLGMNKYITDVGYTTLRSFAWTVLGPFREIAGGYMSLGKGLAKGEWRISPKSLHYDPRIAYSVAFPFTIAFIGGLINYMRTGQWPQDWRDYYFPRTGGTVRSGGADVPERMRIPGYHKDFFGFAHMSPDGLSPGDELKAKIAGAWQAIGEQATNRDWRNLPIAPPNATLEEQLRYRGGQLLSRMQPIGLQQLTQEQKKGSKLTWPERFMGFGTAGVRYQNPAGSERFENLNAQRLWQQKERADNADRRSRGLPPLPPRPRPAP
jgi:hypothetical protein